MNIQSTAQRFSTIPPRARGIARVTVKDEHGRTRLTDLHQAGCMKLIFPKRFRPDAEAVLVNTAGGITGGDQLSLIATVKKDAALTLTTQAAERIYKAQDGDAGQVTTDIVARENAQLRWLPQETILFDRAALDRKLTINLAETATALVVETLVFGRTLMGETLSKLYLRDRITINRDGKPLYRDAIALNGDPTVHLARPPTADGAGAVSTLIYTAPDAANHLAPIRTALPKTAGASMITDDTLVLRLLAPDSFLIRSHLIPILDRLTNGCLPINWRL
ncbi:urease accessory protein UreD [Yoonia sp. 2307UL14-13]|uniref:urease accessory protein UreD n=1 Tax=Yoonia sp. 2307UL14-13 TaxID=3126506 RepID=UPI0030A9FA7C